MQIARTFFHSHRLTISISKSRILCPDPTQDYISFPDLPDHPPLSLDLALSYKYLGVFLNSSTRAAFKDFNAAVVKKAQMFMTRALHLTRLGPCRSELLFHLWTGVALPSILYGCEVLPLTKRSLQAISTCQNVVGKSLLQLPRYAANASVPIDAGFRPVQHVIAERVLRYSQKVMLRPSSDWTQKCMSEHLSLHTRSPYYKLLMSHRGSVDRTFPSKASLSKCLTQKSIQETLILRMSTPVTTIGLSIPKSQPSSCFQFKSWVRDSWFSKVFARFRSGCVGLGNRVPLPNGVTYKHCPLCIRDGIFVTNSELHLVMSCPSLVSARQNCMIQIFINTHSGRLSGLSVLSVYRMLLDDLHPWPLMDRIISLGYMKTTWNTLMGIEPTYLGT